MQESPDSFELLDFGAISTKSSLNSMISQYIGNHNRVAEERSICINFLVMILTGVLFFSVFNLFRNQFTGLFSTDVQVITKGSRYLGIISWTFIPLGICNILGTALRCRDKSTWPLYIGVFSALLNTVLNYCLIFGNFGAPELGVAGCVRKCCFSGGGSAGFLSCAFSGCMDESISLLTLGRMDIRSTV